MFEKLPCLPPSTLSPLTHLAFFLALVQSSPGWALPGAFSGGPVLGLGAFPAMAQPGSIPARGTKILQAKRKTKNLFLEPIPQALYPFLSQSLVPPAVLTVSQPPGIECLCHMDKTLDFACPTPSISSYLISLLFIYTFNS